MATGTSKSVESPPGTVRDPRSERGNRKLRLVDRGLGIPLLYAASLFRRRRPLPAPETVQRIGLFMFGAIGDSLLASATIPDLRRRYPAARIVCFATESTRAVSSIIDGIDDWILLPIRNPWRCAATLRTWPVDLLIDFGQWARVTALLTAIAPARYAVGFRTRGQARHFPYDAAVTHSDQRHELENFRALVSALGVRSEGMPAVRRAPAASGPVPAGRWIVFHPWPAGYRSELREWAETKWIALAEAARVWGYGVIVTGGPSDRARAEALAQAFEQRAVRVLCAAGRSTLPDTVHLLECAAAVVSVNTGLMHIAAALDRPLVALHGPTNPMRWGPVSSRAIVVGPGPDRRCGYLNLGHEYPARPPDCMGCITTAEVIEALGRCIDKDEPRQSTPAARPARPAPAAARRDAPVPVP